MITLQQFDIFLKAIKQFHKREQLLGDSIDIFNSSWTVIEFCPEIVEAIFSFLHVEFNDKGDWIGWWLYEKGDNDHIKAYTIDNQEIKLDSVEELYNFLLENKKDNQ